jgi:hypothetical protein
LWDFGYEYKSTNTKQQLTKPKLPSNTQGQDKSGIYILTCNTCQMPYTGQTNRSLKQRYQEHIRYIRHIEPQSAYALHILNNKHEYGPHQSHHVLIKTTKHHYYYHTNNYISKYTTNTSSLFQKNTQANITPYINWYITHSIRHFPRDQPINTPPSTQLNQFHPDYASRQPTELGL